MSILRPLLSRGQVARRRSRLFAFLPLALFSYYTSGTASAFSSSSSPPQEPAWSSTTGQRYLCVASDGPATTTVPLLLIIPGTAQSIELWEQHLFLIARSRRSSVIICEPLGLGLQVPEDHVDLSIPSQAESLQQTLASLNYIGKNDRPIDIVGFSLGGRIAMAFAIKYPDLVGRLHLTGVALQRSNWGTLQIDAWQDLLKNSSDLRPFAWSALLASYSPNFLMFQRDKLPLWIDNLASRHTLHGLQRLIEQTHQENDEEWSVEAMAKRLASSNNVKGQLCVGEGDQLAPLSQVHALAKALNWSPPSVIPRAAHVPPIENPTAWRKDLESFLK